MDLKKILMVSGKSGLFELVSNGKNNLIVESLIDKTRMPIFSTVRTRVTTLHDICIFTEEEDLPLVKAFEMIDNFTGKQIIENVEKMDNQTLKNKMAEMIPTYDKEKVHVSDIKKLFSWYNLLTEKNILDFTPQEETTENAPDKEAITEEEK
ncbi:MAG: DUF5606 domain-containing protein [Bacteroidales bacterium]|jgi:ASC-1-like (ASCH) protein|nr:DUF5606 domain-containing protein [Bacteroidales bacterium]